MAPDDLPDLDPKVAELVQKAVEEVRVEFLRKLQETRDRLERMVRGGERVESAAGVEADAEAAPPADQDAPTEEIELAPPPAVIVSHAELRDAVTAIDRGRTQEEILTALLEAGTAFASRAALFLTRTGGLEGWAAAGFGKADETFKGHAIEYGEETPWALLAEGRGAVELEAGQCGELCSGLEVTAAESGVLVPLVLRDRLAATLYAERTEGADATDLAALQVVTYVAAQALETLPLRSRASTATLRWARDASESDSGLALWESPEAEETLADEPAAEETQEAQEAIVEEAAVDEDAGDVVVEEAEAPHDIEPEAWSAPEPETELEIEPEPAAADEEEAWDTREPEPATELPEEGAAEATVEETPEAESIDESATAESSGFAMETIPAPELEGPDPFEDEPPSPGSEDGGYAIEPSPWPISGESIPIDDGAPEGLAEEEAEKESREEPDFPEAQVEEAAPTEAEDEGPTEEDEGATEEEVMAGALEEEPIAEEPPSEPEPTAPEEPEAEEPPAEMEASGEPDGAEAETPSPPPVESTQPVAVPVTGIPGSGTQVSPPEDVEGPGWAFSAAGSAPEGSPEARQEEARRLARLLVTEIKLYNEEQVAEGRQKGDIYSFLRDDIDRSRVIYEERIDEEVRQNTDYFRDELVRILAGGKADDLGD